MSNEPFGDRIRDHLASPPRPAAPVDPDQLGRPREARSADGNVTATVDGQTLAVSAITIDRVTDPVATGSAVVEAVNAALAQAETGGLDPDGLERAIADRVAELDRAMDRISGRLDGLSDRLDSINRTLDAQPQPTRRPPTDR